MPRKELKEWIPPKETYLFKIQGQLLCLMTSLFTFILMKILNKTTIYGQDIIDREKGPYIFASNHISMFDSGFIDGMVFYKKNLQGYDYAPYHTPEYNNFYRNFLLSYYMDHVKCIPLTRGKGIDQPAQKVVNEKLLNGGIVHIFPEGTRSRSGELLPAKGGVGKRIYETKVKVIPCYHEGMRGILPIGKYIPRIGNRVKISIGEPIYFDDLFAKDNVPDTWREIANRIMEHIKMLKDDLKEK
ncbi:MAG: 1-acyl-sn-glycerol-3-phosphate acyltransferase [Candidatus Delongbacteria bacterium]|nr:1-acyl-sn-glycerol-3-phosphate acyltransferase [Candidatus Delongbacteria bacterium]MBN2834722.1 1-acyl-sn-glycerol-3-phosphate acyltransferase [Candidatus Delongbacteria bacterium]